MAEPKSHRERSRIAARQVYACSEEGAPAIIARETFPAELVQTAKELLERLDCARPEFKPIEVSLEEKRSALRAALALYPEQEAP